MEWLFLIIYVLVVIFARHIIKRLLKTKKELLIDEEIKELRLQIKNDRKLKVVNQSRIIELKLSNIFLVIKDLFVRFGLIAISFIIFKKIFTISIWWYILAVITLSIIIKRLFKWEY